MVQKDSNKSDDFFSLLAKDQKIENPFSQDEILFRDENGNLKVLKDGKISDFEDENEDETKVEEVKNKTVVKVSKEKSIVKKQPLPVPSQSQKPLDIDKEVEVIINESGIHFSDDKTAKRFRNIIISRLREVRDQIQTREILLSSSEIGGMGFNSEEADRVLGIISQEFDKMNGKLRYKASNEPFSDLRAEAKVILAQPFKTPSLVFSDKLEIQKDKKVDKELSRLNKEPKPVISVPQPIKLMEKRKIEIKPDLPVKKISKIEKKIEAQPSILPRPTISSSSIKPKIQDVKFKPKLTGPIEEIRSMKLLDFRQFGSTPDEIIKKIIEKIDLLEKVSFTMRIDGIRAWKESEVYRIYLSIGDQSMEQKKSVSEVIADQENTLSEKEFEAIMELNQKLRY